MASDLVWPHLLETSLSDRDTDPSSSGRARQFSLARGISARSCYQEDTGRRCRSLRGPVQPASLRCVSGTRISTYREPQNNDIQLLLRTSRPPPAQPGSPRWGGHMARHPPVLLRMKSHVCSGGTCFGQLFQSSGMSAVQRHCEYVQPDTSSSIRSGG